MIKLGFRIFGLPSDAFGSIDVTERCNLRCKHCYFHEHEQPDQGLTPDQWIALLENWKRSHSRLRFPFFQCSWLGGVAEVAGGFTFDFYTPMIGADSPLWIPWAERDRIIDRVVDLRRYHPECLRVTEPALKLMRADSAANVTRDCLFAKKAFSWDAADHPKSKCMMGANVDRSRCGCIVPFYLHSIVH